MLDLLNKTETETKLDSETKRGLIESELRKDAGRSDREIARVVGVDHKTIAAARKRMGIASPLGNVISPPTPTERCHMLIEACKEFDSKILPESPEEAVDNAIAKGIVTLAPEHENLVTAAVDQCNGRIARLKAERQTKAAVEDEANGEQTMVRSQREITIQFRDDTGEWVIKQKCWPDDDGEIWINEEHMQAFLDALCDRLGIGSIRGA